MLHGECMVISPVAIVDYGDGHGSITFVPLPPVVDYSANLVVLPIDSIKNNTIPIGYTIYRFAPLVRDFETIHRKR